MPAPETLDRLAARVVMIDPTEAVLLLSGRDPAQSDARAFWFVPGGGTEEGETLEQAARREIYEETGAALGELGPVVWRRHAQFAFDGTWYNQRECFFVVRTERFVPRPTALTDLEQRFTTGAGWWPLDELASTLETVYPVGLAALTRTWLSSGPPAAASVID